MKKAKPNRPLRLQIAALEMIRALESHVLGTKKMSATQVSAALALLKKRLPDLATRTLGQRKKTAAADDAHEDALKDLK